jgi:phthiodiolone/phenolphthiodiolone dimycocerosates ketoreductase
MTTQMKVGVFLPAVHSLELNEMTLKGFEQVGFDSAWLPDHLLGLFHADLWRELPMSAIVPDCDTYLDPFVLAGALGTQTHLQLGTSVTDGVRRRGPDLARAALTLNHSAKGGFVLGIGSGEAESCVPFGYDFRRPVGQLEEVLVDLRSLFDRGRMPDGGPGRLGHPAQVGARVPQIWVAAHGPRMLELTGRYGDGWYPTGLTPADYKERYTRIREIAEDCGRPTPVGAMMPLVAFGDSRGQIATALENQPIARLFTLFAPAELWRRHGLEHPGGPTCRGYPDVIPHAIPPDQLREIAQRIPFELVDDFMVLGNGREVADTLKPYAEAGLEHVVLADLTGLFQAPSDVPRLMQEVADCVRALKAKSSATAAT